MASLVDAYGSKLGIEGNKENNRCLVINEGRDSRGRSGLVMGAMLLSNWSVECIIKMKER